MLDLELLCPHCGHSTEGNSSRHGQQVSCPRCREMYVVPQPMGHVKEGRLVSKRPPASAQEGERVIFEESPSPKAFLGQMIFGGLILVMGLFAFFGGESDASRFGLVPIFVGGVFALDVLYKTYSNHYKLTTERLIVRQGLIARQIDEIELYRIKDISVTQGIIQRLLDYGTLTILAMDDSTPVVQVVGVANPLKLKETLRAHYRAARRLEGVSSTEFVQ